MLPPFLIHIEPQLYIMGVVDPTLGYKAGYWAERVKPLRSCPWQSLLFAFVLYISSCHVNGDYIALQGVYSRHSIIGREIAEVPPQY